MSCGSLMALQASLASVAEVSGDHGRAEAAIRSAIELVRSALAELEGAIPGARPSQLAFGFVAAGPGRRQRAD